MLTTIPVSAGAALLRRLLRGQLARRRPRRAARDAVDDLLRDGLEGLGHVDVGLGRGLDEAHVVLGGERLKLLASRPKNPRRVFLRPLQGPVGSDIRVISTTCVTARIADRAEAPSRPDAERKKLTKRHYSSAPSRSRRVEKASSGGGRSGSAASTESASHGRTPATKVDAFGARIASQST